MDGNANNAANLVERLLVSDPLCLPKLRPPTTELVKYVMVELDVPRENHTKFKQLMRPLVEIMFDLKRWELVFAAYPITGVVNRFVHIWNIPDESSIIEVMRDGAQQDEEEQIPGVDPDLAEEFRQVYQAIQALVTTTQHTLLTSLPYDPAHVGFQTHTVIIDTDEDKFSIDHEKLRNASYVEDISDDLEVLRRKREKVRSTTGTAPAQKHADVGALRVKGREAELETIQEHLNRGTSVGFVTLDEQDALLFNLAALKPKGVFQQLDQKFVDTTSDRKKFRLVDLPVNLVLIAAPWGAVYKLDEGDIQRLATPLNDQDVKKALQPLIDGRVPLAAVPEERDTTIGDGCACFIINLNSFVRSASGS